MLSLHEVDMKVWIERITAYFIVFEISILYWTFYLVLFSIYDACYALCFIEYSPPRSAGGWCNLSKIVDK